MLIKERGFPEEGDFVLGTVKTIHHHSIFVELDEYVNRTGLLHISEVSPGRIRNLRDYVQEGKKIVCIILRINKDKGYIDLSLRRVNERKRREKLSEIKQKQVVERIIEFVAKETKKDAVKFYGMLQEALPADYDSLFDYFEEVVKDNTLIKKLKLADKEEKLLLELVLQRIKPKELHIKLQLTLACYEGDGLEQVKKYFEKVAKLTTEEAAIDIQFLGSGMYHIDISGEEILPLEAVHEKVREETESFFKKKHALHIIKRVSA